MISVVNEIDDQNESSGVEKRTYRAATQRANI